MARPETSELPVTRRSIAFTVSTDGTGSYADGTTMKVGNDIRPGTYIGVRVEGKIGDNVAFRGERLPIQPEIINPKTYFKGADLEELERRAAQAIRDWRKKLQLRPDLQVVRDVPTGSPNESVQSGVVLPFQKRSGGVPADTAASQRRGAV